VRDFISVAPSVACEATRMVPCGSKEPPPQLTSSADCGTSPVPTADLT
jgi:hypothetical protein